MKKFLNAIVLLIGTSHLQAPSEPFLPFVLPAERLVNSVAFDPDGRTMYFALMHRDVLADRGRRDSTAPELGLYRARRDGAAWSRPELLPFSGSDDDYEPAVTVDGSIIVFNSKRVYPDGRRPERNDLWMVQRSGAGWSAARPVAGVNSFVLEESYPTLDDRRRMVFVRGPVVEGGDDFDLYETTLSAGGVASPPVRLPFSDTRFAEGDPQLAKDGSFMIFTRWDHQAGWQRTCDLYIAFRRGSSWSEPVALSELNTDGPDFGAAISADGKWLYYRPGGGFVRRPLDAVISAARARSSESGARG